MQISPHIHLVGSEQFGLSHPLDCNCYLIDGGSELALVDAGLGLGNGDILANISSAGFRPEKLTHIIVTHSHVGHWGGADGIRRQTGAQVWAPSLGVKGMTEIENDPAIQANIKFGRYPAGFFPKPCTPDRTFGDGERIRIGNFGLTTISTAGHTKDSTCFQFEDDGRRGLLTGDVVFYAGMIGLLNLEGCSLTDYRRDIRKLESLDVDLLLPGHGVFVLRRGQKHIQRAIHKLSDFVVPRSFFEDNEFNWDREYLRTMTG
jgi:glyoxylase-like metal-dependent hydrolase (beta-lactamase superfamily II)